ncbi:hypothetical protein LXJ15735_37790 [Lacrimispora xylanolytica]
MQKDLKHELEKKGIAVEIWDKEKMRIEDSDRIFVVAILEDYSEGEVDRINNEVMEKIYQIQIDKESKKVEKFGDYTMRQILWDVYILYVLLNKETCVDIENVFMLQRDKKYAKKYLIQGKSLEDISNMIYNILKPESYINDVVENIQFNFSDSDICREVCDTENTGKDLVEKYNIKSCQNILDFLLNINSEEYGVTIDEDC